MGVSALTVMLSYETPRRTGNIFSCPTTRIPRRLLFTLPGKSFTSSKRSLCQGKFCKKTNKEWNVCLRYMCSQSVSWSVSSSFLLCNCLSVSQSVLPSAIQTIRMSAFQSVSRSVTLFFSSSVHPSTVSCYISTCTCLSFLRPSRTVCFETNTFSQSICLSVCVS